MVRRAAVVAAVAVGGVLVTGCGSGVGDRAGDGAGSGADRAAASPSAVRDFGKVAVQAELDAAVAAAGLPESVGTGKAGEWSTKGDDGRRQEVAERMAACTVAWSWSAGAASADTAEDGRMDRKLKVMAGDLAERGWREKRPFEEVPLGEDGSTAMAVYKKRGWTLFARHHDLGALRVATVTATEDACTAKFTDEELELLEGGS
ncbi:hypothetical protein H9Y04_41540 [Streptomyces sp. TRM66268-LWL]|uniref:Lipoprotein n=1 Tax=Streptomyces polyasparticus TaxID=2767826 RepID=A0ABR7SU58_9ACTN|nr:hypothetical protein [Streptomyces polyasparticus]MBC9719029.1 hypothetical protein [Streptomyces polyasparticus]